MHICLTTQSFLNPEITVIAYYMLDFPDTFPICLLNPPVIFKKLKPTVL